METADERRGKEAVWADEDLVAASEVRRLEERVRELERLLGRKTMEVEILKEALDLAQVKKPTLLSRSQAPEDIHNSVWNLLRPLINSDSSAGRVGFIGRGRRRKFIMPFWRRTHQSATHSRENAMGGRMFVTVVAILCQINGIAIDGCVEEIVTDSNLTPEITFFECAKGAQAPIAKWMSQHPIYRANWRLARYKCVPGPYEIKGRA